MLHLHDLAATEDKDSFILGGILREQEPIRQAQIFEELRFATNWKQYDPAYFPPYMGWPGYVMSKRAAWDIVRGEPMLGAGYFEHPTGLSLQCVRF